MPVFPSLMRRMQQTSPAMSLFQGHQSSPPLEPSGVNQGSFRSRPPNPFEIQDEPPPTRSSADKIRETVASQLRYEDVAPKLEEIPQTPAFKPKDNYGIKNRLKMMLGGAALGSQRGGGLGAIGGIIAGLVNPESVDRHGYATYVRPQYEAEVKAAMGRNKARMDNFEGEMKARKTISEINQANAPEYAQATGSQYVMVFDKKSGRFVPAMDNGEPVEAASVVVGRGHDTTQRMVAKDNRKAAWERLMKSLEGRETVAQMNIDGRKAVADAANREAMKRLGITEGGKNRRQRLQLQAEGYDLDGGTGTSASTGPARPGGGTGTGSAQPSGPLLEGLRRMLGLDPEDEEQDEFWY